MCGYSTTLMRSPHCLQPQFSYRILYLTTLSIIRRKYIHFLHKWRHTWKVNRGSINAVIYFKPSAECLLISLLLQSASRTRAHQPALVSMTAELPQLHRNTMGTKCETEPRVQLLFGISLYVMCVLIRNSINKDLTRFRAIHPLLRPILFQWQWRMNVVILIEGKAICLQGWLKLGTLCPLAVHKPKSGCFHILVFFSPFCHHCSSVMPLVEFSQPSFGAPQIRASEFPFTTPWNMSGARKGWSPVLPWVGRWETSYIIKS